MKQREKLSILLGLFVAALIISNTLGAKIAEFDLHPILAIPLNILFYPIIAPLQAFLLNIGGRELPTQFFNTITVSVGILSVPIMFLITDVVAEVKGRKKVLEFIITGVLAMTLLLIITVIAINLPAAERSVDDEAYREIFGVTIRMTIASILAFAVSQLHDVWAFEFWKKKTKGRFLWLRNNASTIVSQLIDSTVFMFVAFYRTTPMWDAVFVISLIVPYWIFKILFSLLDTPFAYLGVWWLKKQTKKQE